MTVADRAGCLNCGARLTGAYCSRCGQKRTDTDLSMREFVVETTQELTQWDGKVARSLRALFLQPGLLTRDFLAGRRVRWLMPLRLYLMCSLAFFFSIPLVESITGRSLRWDESIPASAGSRELAARQSQQVRESLPARLFGEELVLRAVRNPDALNRARESALPKGMVLLLPFFAFLTSVAWRKSGLRFPAHLYFALHLQSVWLATLMLRNLAEGFLAPRPGPGAATAAGLSLPGALLSAVSLLLSAYVVWYSVVAFRTVFRDSWTGTLLRTIGVAAFYLLGLFCVSLLLLWLILHSLPAVG